MIKKAGNKKIKKCFVRIIFALSIFSVIHHCPPIAANLAFASVEIQPMRLELELDGGKTQTGYLSFANHGDEDVKLAISPGEYRYMFSDNTVYPEPAKPQALPSCKSWITFKPDKIKLEKGKAQQIQYAINVPAASSGEYVASILIDQDQYPSPLEANRTGQVRIKITPRISIPVYATIKKSLKRSAAISNFTSAASEDKKSVSISITIKNTGTTHIRPKTSLVILDKNGAVANRASLGEALPMFAGFKERLSTVWTPRFPGKYTAIATVDIGTEPLIQENIAIEVKE